MGIELVRFHGACSGCTQQAIQKEGYDFCIACCNFDSNWNLPDQNNRKPTKADMLKLEIKLRHAEEI
jgi:hypothetical protein